MSDSDRLYTGMIEALEDFSHHADMDRTVAGRYLANLASDTEQTVIMQRVTLRHQIADGEVMDGIVDRSQVKPFRPRSIEIELGDNIDSTLDGFHITVRVFGDVVDGGSEKAWAIFSNYGNRWSLKRAPVWVMNLVGKAMQAAEL